MIQSNETGKDGVCIWHPHLVLDPAVVILLLLTAREFALAVQLAGLIAITTVLETHAFRILASRVASTDALAFVRIDSVDLTRLGSAARGLADLAIDASVGGGMLGIVVIAVISNVAIDAVKFLADRDFSRMELTALAVIIILIAVALLASWVSGAEVLAVVGKEFECDHAK